MKKALTTIILSAVGLFTSTVNVAQEAHRLTKPNPTQSERQPMRLTPLGKSIVRKASNGTPRTIDPSVTLWGNATIDGEWVIILSILKVQGAR